MLEERQRLQERLLRQPGWIEFPAGFFPVILVVFVLRSFLFEPFRIPSGSMIPTLLVGDLILVNKFTYGIRLPIVNKKIIAIGDPQRGDVMVFRYPVDPSVDYVKRVIGLPGDTVTFKGKRLTVNGQPVDTVAAPDYYDPERVSYAEAVHREAAARRGVHRSHDSDRRRPVRGDEPRPVPGGSGTGRTHGGSRRIPGELRVFGGVHGSYVQSAGRSLFHDG